MLNYKRYPREKRNSNPPMTSGELTDQYSPFFSTESLVVKAGEIINGGKVVVIKSDGKAYIYDINDESNYSRGAGIASTAVLEDENLTIKTTGFFVEPGSGWTAGTPYFVSNTGSLTNTPPSSGIIFQIASGLDTDTILINNSFKIIT